MVTYIQVRSDDDVDAYYAPFDGSDISGSVVADDGSYDATYYANPQPTREVVTRVHSQPRRRK